MVTTRDLKAFIHTLAFHSCMESEMFINRIEASQSIMADHCKIAQGHDFQYRNHLAYLWPLNKNSTYHLDVGLLQNEQSNTAVFKFGLESSLVRRRLR